MSNKKIIKTFADKEYKEGFDAHIKTSTHGISGINETSVKAISARNSEPSEVLQKRLAALKIWQTLKEPHWAIFDYPPIDYANLNVFAEPALDKATEEQIQKTYDRLGVPLREQEIMKGMAVDAVVDSRSVATTYKKQLAEKGIIFCPISEALREHKELVLKYLGTVIPPADNFFAALNSAIFSDGTFVYIPKNTKCPIELSSYFRLQTEKVGQFERTLIVADVGAELTYLEGCSAPSRDTRQLHGGVVEIVALSGAKVNYATVQNWFAGDKNGNGGILNFVSKRALLHANATVCWTQLEVGAALTWKYPSCILKGEGARGEFYSVAITNNHQCADTGTRMIHLAPNTSSVIRSKGVALGNSINAYRGEVKISKDAIGARNYTKCDNLVIGATAKTAALPTISNARPDAVCEHEASVSSISEEQLFALACLGLDEESATSLIVNGFALDIIKRLPAEFAMEARELINLKVEE